MLPLRISPLFSVIQIVNRLINSAIPVLKILTTAAFINTTILIFNGSGMYRQILLPLVGIAAIQVYDKIAWVIMDFVGSKQKIEIAEKVQIGMIKKRAGLIYQYIEDNDTWDLIGRVCRDPVSSIYDSFNCISGICQTIIKIGSLIIMLGAYIWWGGIVVLLLCVPMLIISFIGGKLQYNAHIEVEKHTRRADYYKRLLTDREYTDERSLFSYSDPINKRWFELFEKARKITFRVNLKNQIKMNGMSVVIGLFGLLTGMVLLSPLLNGVISIGIFIAFTNYILRDVRDLTGDLSDGTKDAARCVGYMRDLKKFYELPDDLKYLAGSKTSAVNHCDIEFRSVSFRYPNTEKYILKNFSVKLENGVHYALVGVNGAGKSTLTKLLLGLYEEYDGDIIINDKNIKEYDPSELKEIISIVFQDFARYKISVRDNVSLHDLINISEEKIISALKTVGLEDTMSLLSNNLDTILGKLGSDDDISGGQWQRLAVSRALVKDAPLMILDEPTASLDPIAENEIYLLFDQIHKNKTAVLITHRLGSARLADRILVLDEGFIKEEGTHDELMALGGLYEDMFNHQRSWYK
jgi:ATP-binding cassette subfamily B protein